MKRILFIILLATVTFTSCTKNTSGTTQATQPNSVDILSASKVNEPNGEIGRSLKLSFTISDNTKIKYCKMYKQTSQLFNTWQGSVLKTQIIYITDHSAGNNEVYYTFKFEMTDGTEIWQQPILTKIN